MADDVTLPGIADKVAADEISSVKYQRMKLVSGEDGTNDGDTAHSNPFPVIAKMDDLIEVMERVQVQLSIITGLQLNKGDVE